MASRDRDYVKEYRLYQGTEEQKKKRAQRNKARRMMERAGKVHKGDGREVDHIHPMRAGGTTRPDNLRVVSQARNRGWRDGKV